MEQHHDIVEKVDQSRRGFVRKALAGSFMVPVMASFGMSAMSISDAAAQAGNQGEDCRFNLNKELICS